ncbi:alpha/beta hydrolase [Aestuariivivens sediminis]|uniref:alpha/beta hydrolase n=1 Tax=Aestuariivivens sediminis TaxID=2913557 RepID=UPI001F574959|nr:alpha/beta hydrolase [Aestuariivivens sediminis]
MKKSISFFLLLNTFFVLIAQNIIKLPLESSGQIVYHNNEKEYFSNILQTKVVTNVSSPTIEVFQPSEELKNGTAVIIAPGGGFYGLNIELHGKEIAEWLNNKGITVFVLKYRLVPTGEDGVAELFKLIESNPAKIGQEISKVIQFSINDGLNAISHVRSNASKFGVKSDKIGLMGFSAGGAVAMGVVYNFTGENKPDFLVTAFPWTTVMPVQVPPKDAPPMFVVCASNDDLGVAPGSIQLYNSWLEQGLNTELHMYSKGGHGFGIFKNELPSSKWIERFYEWAVSEDFVP